MSHAFFLDTWDVHSHEYQALNLVKVGMDKCCYMYLNSKCVSHYCRKYEHLCDADRMMFCNVCIRRNKWGELKEAQLTMTLCTHGELQNESFWIQWWAHKKRRGRSHRANAATFHVLKKKRKRLLTICAHKNYESRAAVIYLLFCVFVVLKVVPHLSSFITTKSNNKSLVFYL